MRGTALCGKAGMIGIILILITMGTLKYTLDKSYLQVGTINNQLIELNNRYRQLLGNPVNNLASPSSSQCSPIQKVAFAKTHKTGSSTLQNIFFRYGVNNKLTFAIPERSWMYSFKEPFNASVITRLPWAKLGYDLFIFHSVWNYPEVKKVLPSAVYITLLRNPVDCYESNYVYMGLEKAFRMDINKYAQMKARLLIPRRPTAIIGKNQQLWDLGLPATAMENPDLVTSKIHELDSQFHFVLFADHFDESLVLLARLLCWQLEDVKYLKQNARKAEKKTEITPEARALLKSWLAADFQLYDHFHKKYLEAVERYGKEALKEDVAKLQKLNKELTEDCVKEVADNSKLKGEFRMALDIVEGYVIDTSKPWCAPYARSEPNFSVQARKAQMVRASVEKSRARDRLLAGIKIPNRRVPTQQQIPNKPPSAGGR